MADSLDLTDSNDAASKAIASGQTAINSFDPTTTAGAQQQNTGNLFNTQQKQTNDYVGKYTQAVANNPTVQSLYQQGNDMFNVPALQTQATNLSNRVTNALPNAYQAARGFDIGSPQVQNGVAQSLAYLTPQSNAATANANTASGLASNFVQAGQAQNAQNLLPVQAEQQNLLQEQAAQATGWNNAAQNEYAGLIAKLQAGVQLSQSELERANTLATLQESYQQALQANQSAQETARIQNQYKEVGQNNNLFNAAAQSFINPTIANPNGLRKL